jgi:glycosyltransferase involved in cell wall biosynthesis
MNEIEVSVVMPCLNEERTLPACIETAKRAMSENNISGEILVSDNGSTDQSVKVATEHGARVVHASNKGYGNALKCGMRAAKGKFLVMADPDGSYDFNDIPKFIAPLRGGADFVMGSRIKGTIHPGAMPFLNRNLGTPALTFIANLFFGSRITDINCGMRSLTKKAFEKMNLRAGGMEFASEMVIKASLLKLKTEEVPTSLFPDKRDRPPHLRPFRDGWRHLSFMFLFAPTWLFLIPGIISSFAGCLLLAAMLFYSPNTFGIFTMVFAEGLIILGAQVIFLGISARGFSQFKRLSIRKNPIDRFIMSFTIERGIIAGIIIAGIGVWICAWVGWELMDFISKPGNLGIFNMRLAKIGTVGTTLAILGLQLIFSSFYSGLFNVEIAENDEENRITTSLLINFNHEEHEEKNPKSQNTNSNIFNSELRM